MFIRVYRLGIQSVMLGTQHCELLPKAHPTFSLFQLSPFPVWISILYSVVYTLQCITGRGWVWDDKHLPLSPFTGHFFDDIFHCLLWVLSFYEYYLMYLFNFSRVVNIKYGIHTAFEFEVYLLLATTWKFWMTCVGFNQGCGNTFISSRSGSSILGWIPIRIQYGSGSGNPDPGL